MLHLPDYAKGYLTFVLSILGIGLLTAFIGDLASHFGCTIGLKDSITAIAFVALGTSVPGTLWLFGSASRVAPLPRRGATGKPEVSQLTTVSTLVPRVWLLDTQRMTLTHPSPSTKLSCIFCTPSPTPPVLMFSLELRKSNSLLRQKNHSCLSATTAAQKSYHHLSTKVTLSAHYSR